MSQKQNPSNFEQNKRVAKGGGHVARIARAELEKQLGRSVVSPASAKGLKAPDDVKQIETGDSEALPPKSKSAIILKRKRDGAT